MKVLTGWLNCRAHPYDAHIPGSFANITIAVTGPTSPEAQVLLTRIEAMKFCDDLQKVIREL